MFYTDFDTVKMLETHSQGRLYPVQGLIYPFYYYRGSLTLTFLHFSKQIMYSLEENFAKIYLPVWQFYLLQIIRKGYIEPWYLS